MERDINFGEIEEVLGRILGESMGFEDMVEQMLTDGRVLSPGKWMELFLKLQRLGFWCLF